MVAKRRAVPVRGIIIYVAVILISGYLLQASGHLDNPFTEITSTFAMLNGAPGGPGGGAFGHGSPVDGAQAGAGGNIGGFNRGTPPGGAQSAGTITAGSAPATGGSDNPGGRDGGPDNGNINLSQIGDVLFDNWFIGAMTALFIVIQLLFNFVVGRLKQRNRSGVGEEGRW